MGSKEERENIFFTVNAGGRLPKKALAGLTCGIPPRNQ
jgi:hypothetical protein